MPELCAVTGALDGSARGVSEHHDQLGPGDLPRELETAQNVRVDDVPGDTHAEDITEPLIEDQVSGRPRIDATEDRSERPLPVAGLVHLLNQERPGL